MIPISSPFAHLPWVTVYFHWNKQIVQFWICPSTHSFSQEHQVESCAVLDTQPRRHSRSFWNIKSWLPCRKFELLMSRSAGKKRGHHSGREVTGLASVRVWIMPLDMLARLAVMLAENEEISRINRRHWRSVEILMAATMAAGSSHPSYKFIQGEQAHQNPWGCFPRTHIKQWAWTQQVNCSGHCCCPEPPAKPEGPVSPVTSCIAVRWQLTACDAWHQRSHQRQSWSPNS